MITWLEKGRESSLTCLVRSSNTSIQISLHRFRYVEHMSMDFFPTEIGKLADGFLSLGVFNIWVQCLDKCDFMD